MSRMSKRYHVPFPFSQAASDRLSQDEVLFSLLEEGDGKRLQFNDYYEAYQPPITEFPIRSSEGFSINERYGRHIMIGFCVVGKLFTERIVNLEPDSEQIQVNPRICCFGEAVARGRIGFANASCPSKVVHDYKHELH